MVQHAHGGVSSDAQGRDNVIDAELALDHGRFLAMRVKMIVAIGAYLQFNMPVFFPTLEVWPASIIRRPFMSK